VANTILWVSVLNRRDHYDIDREEYKTHLNKKMRRERICFILFFFRSLLFGGLGKSAATRNTKKRATTVTKFSGRVRSDFKLDLKDVYLRFNNKNN